MLAIVLRDAGNDRGDSIWPRGVGVDLEPELGTAEPRIPVSLPESIEELGDVSSATGPRQRRGLRTLTFCLDPHLNAYGHEELAGVVMEMLGRD